jgi:hypothetical protein
VVSTIWTRFFELWTAWNQIVHGVNTNNYTTIQKSKLVDEIKELHSRWSSFCRSDLPFLISQHDDDAHKIDEFVKQNYVLTLRTWLRMWKPTFDDGAKLASSQAVLGTRMKTTQHKSHRNKNAYYVSFGASPTQFYSPRAAEFPSRNPNGWTRLRTIERSSKTGTVA